MREICKHDSFRLLHIVKRMRVVSSEGVAVQGLLNDSGVPGAIAHPPRVPVSVFACRGEHEFWHGGQIGPLRLLSC